MFMLRGLLCQSLNGYIDLESSSDPGVMTSSKKKVSEQREELLGGTGATIRIRDLSRFWGRLHQAELK